MQLKKVAIAAISVFFSFLVILPAISAQPMVLIPKGEFTMGSPEVEGYPEEHPQHKVFLDAYRIDKYEVTVAQYRAFCQATRREMPQQPLYSTDNHPIVKVSWDDATAYATYYGKRLPTEAEWEKAARAGSTTRYCFGEGKTALKNYAWYSANSNKQTHPVGTKKPNAFGLYDMHGNVWEWCFDRYDENYYASSPANNPKSPSAGQFRVLRGGGCRNTANHCRPADRGWDYPSDRLAYGGFRCASSP